ncbi:MAG: hypothetical protein LQ352_003378 [Teloschistes flavicans]|nr:MAG: hypothetical protein LQ352_003378 [Teloschistes flavicans]
MATLLERKLLASQLSHHDRSVGCIAYDPLVEPTYGYVPSLAAGVVFVVVFFLIFVAHCVQTAIKRQWWYSLIALGALGELLGWIARIWASRCPYNSTAFSMQISVLIIAPCFFSAAIYYILGQLIKLWGTQHSPISARLYLIIFAGFDLLSIIIQAIGGGTASKASAAEPPKSTLLGTHLMMAGIIIQLVSMCVFAILFLWVIWRARAVRRDSKISFLLMATTFSAACIIIRNFYRAVELSQGWRGYLITHEVYFDVLDGMLMVLASVAFNIVHPAWCIDGSSTPSTLEMREK